MSSQLNRKIIVSMSDSHSGNVLGLRMPETKLASDDGGDQRNLSEIQIYLYGIYEAARQKIIDLAGEDEIILLHSGDVCQGNKYTDDRETGTIADDILIARDNLVPFTSLSNVKSVIIAKGTSAHNFGNGSAEILVAELLRQQYPQKHIQAINHGLLDIDGLTIDIAHHGASGGRRIWLQGNELRYYLRDIMLTEIAHGNRPCDLYLRGHFHTYIKETLWIEDRGIEYESLCVLTPSMCMIGSFGMMAMKSPIFITNGIIAFEVVNNKILAVHRYISTKDIRIKDRL